jgi:hypothetical protein
MTLFAETRLLLTFRTVFLDVHLFQTKVEFVVLQLLQALHCKIKILLVFIGT